MAEGPALESYQLGGAAGGLDVPACRRKDLAMSTVPGPVFVVDDDAAVRNALKFALELEGFHVRAYRGGAEMLADEDLGPGGCLIVDQYMPGMSGVELVDRLRERFVDIPAILITAKPSDDLRLSAALSGIRQVLEKPLEDGALLEGIRSALAAARAPAEADLDPHLRDSP